MPQYLVRKPQEAMSSVALPQCGGDRARDAGPGGPDGGARLFFALFYFKPKASADKRVRKEITGPIQKSSKPAYQIDKLTESKIWQGEGKRPWQETFVYKQ